MSTCLSKEITCPACGEVQSYSLWPSITTTTDPDLRVSILRERLFHFSCAHCGHSMQVPYPLLYHDPNRRLLFALTPMAHEDAALQVCSEADGLQKRTVHSLSRLKEKILIFESGLDDAAVELVKAASVQVLRKQYQTLQVQMFFCKSTPDETEFAVFLPDSPEPIYRHTKTEAYRKALQVLELLQYHPEPGFPTVDEDLAQQLLAAYRAR